MSFLRVSNPSAITAVNLYDLGVTVAISAVNVVLSDQFSVQDLLRSADLENAIIAGDLTVQIDYGTGFASVAAVDYTNRDALGAFLNIYEITNENNNEKLVDGSDASTLHNHASLYYTHAQLNASTGAALIGDDASGWAHVTGANVQAALNSIDVLFSTAVTLDTAYTNDSDGVLDVNGASKPLNFRSNGTNEIAVSRKVGTDAQDFLRASMSTNQLVLGAAVSGALSQVDVRILTNLIVDGNVTFTGTVTDTTVSNLEVTNANIKLRTGAASGADASVEVVRGSSGTDAALTWSETAQRWKAGLLGSGQTIALLERDETVLGTWKFAPTLATDPNLLLTGRAAPTTGLGGAGEAPVAMITGGQLAIYDKSSSRNKWLSIARTPMVFTGRSSNNVKNEYAYIGTINSFETGLRIPVGMTLVSMTAQAQTSATWTARVRKNGAATNVASLAVTAALGATDETLNVDCAAGDLLQVYIDTAAGPGIAAPIIRLEFARRY